jgi:hypothetical protein
MRLVFLILFIVAMVLLAGTVNPQLARDIQHAKQTVLVSICPARVSSPFCHVMTLLLYDT